MVDFGEYQKSLVFGTCLWPAGCILSIPDISGIFSVFDQFCVSESREMLDAKIDPLHVQHPQHWYFSVFGQFCVSESREMLDAKIDTLHVQHPQHHFHVKNENGLKIPCTPLSVDRVAISIDEYPW